MTPQEALQQLQEVVNHLQRAAQLLQSLTETTSSPAGHQEDMQVRSKINLELRGSDGHIKTDQTIED